MKELSLLALLEARRQENTAHYAEIEKLVNIHHPDRYDQITSTSLESYQGLRSAGFPAESLLDELSEGELTMLLKAYGNYPSRIFVEADIDFIVQTYALRKYATYHYQGQRWDKMNQDIQTFQEEFLLDRFRKQHAYGYSMVGLSPSLTDYPTDSSRRPLVFFKIGKDIFLLISSYDSWIPAVRKILYWPFSSKIQGTITYVIFLAAFMSLILFLPENSPGWSVILLIVLFFALFFFAMSISLLRPRNHPDSFPKWLNHLMYRFLPY